jgi:hypothetical protein
MHILIYTIDASHHRTVLAHKTAMLALLISDNHLRLVILEVLFLVLLRVHKVILLILIDRSTPIMGIDTSP